MILLLLPPPYSWPDGLFTDLYCSAVIQGCVKRRCFISRQTDLHKHLSPVAQTLDNAIHRIITIQQISVGETNRSFYGCGGHIELIRFKEYYGMSRGHERDPIYSLSIYARFSGQFFSKFPEKKILMGKKDRCAVFWCTNDRLFPEKYIVNFSFCPKSARKYWASAPGQPIILLRSNKFNMAAVSVKRSIALSTW